MTSDLDTALAQKHEVYEAAEVLWGRYRAFSQDMSQPDDKEPWIPQGAEEDDDSYHVRVALTHAVGLSRQAVRRMNGGVTKAPAERKYAGALADTLTEWDTNVDQTGRDIHGWFRQITPGVLNMGIRFVFVDQTRPDETAKKPDPLLGGGGATGSPFLEIWEPEEVINWGLDRQGRLEWAVLCRVVTRQTGPLDAQENFLIYKVLTREGGAIYEGEIDPATKNPKNVQPVGEWIHNLGMVPLVPIYAHKLAAMEGESYIDEISLADWRILQLESDQSMNSFLHGNPREIIKTKRSFEDLGVGSSKYLKLNPDDGEDHSYSQVDTGGMQVREDVIKRTTSQGKNSAGIDDAGQGTAQATSGVAIAYRFAESETPTLITITEELDTADRQIHEIVARYLSGGKLPGLEEEVFDGTIQRPRSWDMLATSDLVGFGLDFWSHLKTETGRKALAKQVLVRIMPGLDEETKQASFDEIDAEDYSVQGADDFGDPDADPDNPNPENNDGNDEE